MGFNLEPQIINWSYGISPLFCYSFVQDIGRYYQDVKAIRTLRRRARGETISQSFHLIQLPMSSVFSYHCVLSVTDNPLTVEIKVQSLPVRECLHKGF